MGLADAGRVGTIKRPCANDHPSSAIGTGKLTEIPSGYLIFEIVTTEARRSLRARQCYAKAWTALARPVTLNKMESNLTRKTNKEMPRQGTLANGA